MIDFMQAMNKTNVWDEVSGKVVNCTSVIKFWKKKYIIVAFLETTSPHTQKHTTGYTIDYKLEDFRKLWEL